MVSHYPEEEGLRKVKEYDILPIISSSGFRSCRAASTAASTAATNCLVSSLCILVVADDLCSSAGTTAETLPAVEENLNNDRTLERKRKRERARARKGMMERMRKSLSS